MPPHDPHEAPPDFTLPDSFDLEDIKKALPSKTIRFILDEKPLWLPSEQVQLVAPLPDLDPTSGDWDPTIHYRLYELYLLTPPGLYVLREINHYPEECEQHEADRVVSEHDAVELCHAANVTPDGPLGGLIGRVADAGLDAVYAHHHDKLASADTRDWRAEELTPRRFTFRGVPMDWGKSSARYRLVLSLWDVSRHQPAPPREKSEVSAIVYPRETQTRAKLKDLVKQVRKMFADAGMPLRLRDEGGQLSLEETPA